MSTPPPQDLNGWRNWDGRQHCFPHVIERPQNILELRGALDRARAAGRKVRVAGSGHSFTGLVVTDGSLVSMERMNRVLEVDPSSGVVRAEAGITIAELNRQLDRHGLAFENLGDIDRQTLAGATATGTHGTGSRLRNISSQLLAVELMRADGTVIKLDERGDPDGWRAARVSLGALGVVTSLTLQTVPAYRLHGVDGPAPLEQTLELLDQLPEQHDHFEMYWFPYSQTALLRRNDRSVREPTPRSRVREYLEDIVLVNHGLSAFSRVGRRYPVLIPALNRLVTRIAGSSDRVDVSHRIFVSPRLVRFTEMEYAIPRIHGPEAIRAIRQGLQARRLPINFPIEVRFVAADDALLSPAHARDTCYVAVHAFDQMEYEPYFRMVEEIMDGFGGRPHWGKRHFQTAASLAPRYPQWDLFQQVRARMDPEGLFANAELERVLGPVGATDSA